MGYEEQQMNAMNMAMDAIQGEGGGTVRWRIYGGSDDLIEVEEGPVLTAEGRVVTGGEEFGAYAHGRYRGRMIVGKLLADEEGSGGRSIVYPGVTGARVVPLAVVHALYGPAGCWSFAFGLWDEEDGLPDGFDAWGVRVVGCRGHSTVLEVVAPDRGGMVLTFPLDA